MSPPRPEAPTGFGVLRETLRRMLGSPDYAGYLAHRQAKHPGEPVLDYATFFRERQAAKYRRGATRCC